MLVAKLIEGFAPSSVTAIDGYGTDSLWIPAFHAREHNHGKIRAELDRAPARAWSRVRRERSRNRAWRRVEHGIMPSVSSLSIVALYPLGGNGLARADCTASPGMAAELGAT